MLRIVVIGAAALTLAPAALARTAQVGATPSAAAPSGLRAFLLTPKEAPLQYYPRTPSFTWNPVARRGGTYDFQLATSMTFADASLLDDETGLKVPAVAPAEQLPWMTGVPYALWAHVRWESANHKVVTPWSRPFGFNMRWLDSDYPQQESAPEGLIRWKPIEGATGYQVLYPDLEGKNSFTTTTNVADEREFFTFHSALGYQVVHWRVRAIRYISSTTLPNGLTASKYGPWSPVFTTVNLPQPLGTLTPTATVSDVWDHAGQAARPHELTPGFAWNPATTPVDPLVGSVGSPLYRVYVFTDNHCVNPIFTGSVVGSPAFAPRTTGGPFNLPQSTQDLGNWTGANGIRTFTDGGSEGSAIDATGAKVTANEAVAGADGQAAVDLGDSGWPTGRFYWTVVPVEAEATNVTAPAPGSSQAPQSYSLQYQDTQVPQDQCENGLGMSFGKVSQPVVTSGATPYVSGVGTDGRMIASAAKTPVVHDSPLVAWQPAVGATSYEIQLSRTRYPWRTAWDKVTTATAYVLPLGTNDVGTWWYRVRGIDPSLPKGAQTMTWSTAVSVRISGDRFVVVEK
ncbi:MAG TPA: hypothetical protein VFA05_09470 [Gaiellaceae bacterium]|nr:hypothetical protein [Gaiellaceae bacterium]